MRQRPSDRRADATVARLLLSRRALAIGLTIGVAVVTAAGASLLLGRSESKGGAQVVTIELSGRAVYYELPAFLADLSSGGQRANHIKLSFVVEIPQNQLPRLKEQEALIVDAVQSYLRKQERRGLVGDPGTQRLRSDLLAIVNRTIAPAEAKDVLFKELLLD